MMRTAILAGAALLALVGTAHARQWFLYNAKSLQCESSTDETESPEKAHLALRERGIVDSIEVVKDPETNEVMAALISAELTNSQSPTIWVWFTSKELCEKMATKIGPSMKDLE